MEQSTPNPDYVLSEQEQVDRLGDELERLHHTVSYIRGQLADLRDRANSGDPDAARELAETGQSLQDAIDEQMERASQLVARRAELTGTAAED